MANEFIARKGLIVSGSARVTGSLNVSGGITGSLLGTASYATNAATASIYLGTVTSASFATTSSAATSITFTPSTASYASNADLLDGLNSTVFATTGSNTFVGNQTVVGRITAIPQVASLTPPGNGFLSTHILLSSSLGSTALASYLGQPSFTHGGSASISFTDKFIVLPDASGLGWVATDSPLNTGSLDTTLYRDINDTLALRRTTNAQTFRIYNTYTSLANFERAKLQWSGSVFYLGTEQSGSGVARPFVLQTNGTDRVFISASGEVGIGTNVPGATLHVQGNVSASAYTGSLFGSASFATTASAATSLTFTPISASYAITSSFPFDVTGSLTNPTFYSKLSTTSKINTTGSVYIGESAGLNASGSYHSTFVGNFAGSNALNAYYSMFVGQYAGQNATSANNSIFLGRYAGNGATGASSAVFIGGEAGDTATGANGTIAIGIRAGNSASSATYSTFLGYQAGRRVSGIASIGSHNIIIGPNISVPANANRQINIGGVIFGSGSNSTISGGPISSSIPGARVGIAEANPVSTLQVGGDVSASSYTSSLDNQVGFLGTASWAQNATSASFATTASAATSITFIPTSASYATTASFASIAPYFGLIGIPVGILSSSTQINALTDVSASFATTASAATSITFVPTTSSYAYTSSVGLVAKSVDIVSGSIGSAQTSYTGSFSGSFTGSVTSASYALTASYAANAGAGGGLSGGTANYIPLWTSATAQSSSNIYQSTGNVGIGTTSPGTTLHVQGNISASSYTSSINNAIGYFGTASYATTASVAKALEVISGSTNPSATQYTGSFTGSFTGSLLGSSSYATTASFALNAGGAATPAFPYTGSAVITGSLTITGSSFVRDNLTINGGTLFVDGTSNRVGVGTTSPTRALTVTGSTNITGSLDVTAAFTAQTKSFKILHQTQPDKYLVYGVLEGPEHAVYARGRLQKSTIITLPEEWEWLVDMNSVTVQLTPIGTHQKLYVDGVYGTRIVIGNDNMFGKDIDCYYTVMATRKDVSPLQTIE